MKLGLGLGIAYLAANQTAGAGGEEPPALYGLTDDGEGGVLGDLSLTPDFGWADGPGGATIVTDEYTHLFSLITNDFEEV